MSGSLDGIRVLELARYQAGPRGGMILSDLGAEIIKIEKLVGEETRKSEPLVRGQSVYFSVYNRGKKSLCLDMRTERGKEIFAALVPTADIVLQNFRPGVMETMGFGYDQLRALKPDIILTSVSGFGQYGPYRDRPAFDPLGQAMSGLMSLTGAPVGTPLGAATSLVDRYTSLHATIGTLAALRHRDQTGEGQVVDCCLLDSGFTMVEIPLSYYLATGQEGGEGGRPPYKALDGHVVISASGRAMATRLMQIVTGDDNAAAGSGRATRASRRSPNGARKIPSTTSSRPCSPPRSRSRRSRPSRRPPRIRICGSARCWSRCPTPWPARCTCRARRSRCRRPPAASRRCRPRASTPTSCCRRSSATTRLRCRSYARRR
jgi:crotonobetainyl-CoA:carnitine CoA-transferase CaiB-like acyl-CoA transferase